MSLAPHLHLAVALNGAGWMSGVLDCGGLGAADPALDLVAAWHLLEAQPRAVLRAALDCDDLERSRGAAWAFEQALGLCRTTPRRARS